MTQNFTSVKATSNLRDCSKLLVKKKADSLLVTHKDKLVGILTARDILWAITRSRKLDLKKVKAIDIATRKVAVIKPSAEITQALTKMKSLNLKTLPVLSKGLPVGLLTWKDILSIDPGMNEEIKELLEIKEEERKAKNLSQEYELQGLCDNCGAFSDLLKVYDQSLCADCREEVH